MRDHELTTELTTLHLRLLQSFEDCARRTSHIPPLLRFSCNYEIDADRLSRDSHLVALSALDLCVRGSRGITPHRCEVYRLDKAQRCSITNIPTNVPTNETGQR